MVSKRKVRDLVLFTTLIGTDVEVVDAKNRNLIGLCGKVCDETSSLFVVKSGNEIKKIIKKQVVLKMKVEGKTLKINGELLHRSLIERIKRLK